MSFAQPTRILAAGKLYRAYTDTIIIRCGSVTQPSLSYFTYEILNSGVEARNSPTMKLYLLCVVVLLQWQSGTRMSIDYVYINYDKEVCACRIERYIL